jgi:alkylation response protein AidB-like acyl-CoA dehydrogenase
MRLIDYVWPWARIRRLRRALDQALADNQLLADKLAELADRDERGRFVKRPK